MTVRRSPAANRGLGSIRRASAHRILALCLPLLCGGCGMNGFWLLHPAGPVAEASVQSWIVDTGATFLVIGPATLLVMWAIWRYHRSGKGAYRPGWSHSVPLEATFWGAPLLVVLGLGFYAPWGAYQTDPAGPRVMTQASNADSGKPVVHIDVITTDWQWLFVYPDRHIAVANELVLPVHRPVHPATGRPDRRHARNAHLAGADRQPYWNLSRLRLRL